jgi:hypothetical protein
VREAAVETVPNHEDVGCSEHQSRLSKGVIAKVVQSLKLGSAIQAGAPAARAAGFAPLSLTPGFVADPETQNKLKKPPRPFHFLRWLSPGLSDEQLFLKEKLRQQRSSIRRSGNGTGMVAFCLCLL